MDTDEQLLKRIKAGDREGLAQIYLRYLPTEWRYIYAQLRGDDQACRDVVSETFLAAIHQLVDGNVSIASVGGWLTGVARHKVADHRRLVAKEIRTPQPDNSSDENDPAVEIEAKDTRWLVGQVMDQLDESDRVVLEWKYIDELSVREIAQRLNRSEKAIEAALYRARNAFRILFDNLCSPRGRRTEEIL